MENINKDKYRVVKISPTRRPPTDEELEKEFGITLPVSKRFAIVEVETGEVVDDAQGYGYKTMAGAYKAFYHKLNKEIIAKENINCKKWLNEHKEFANDVRDTMLYIAKNEKNLNNKFIKELANKHGIVLPFKLQTLLKNIEL